MTERPYGDARTAAVVRCRTSTDVAAAVVRAAGRGQRVTPRSGGHCFAGRSSAGDVIVDLSPMHSVSVTGTRAEVQAGVRLGSLYAALEQHQLTLPAGCGATVGIGGLTLGGGLGLLGRLHGLTCDRLSGAEVVLADGRIVLCGQQRHRDLFWALRGAGGSHFGVVTRFVFDLVLEPEVTVFRVDWPPATASRLISAWMDWAPLAADQLTANLELSAAGHGAEPLSVTLLGAMAAEPAAVKAALTELTDRSQSQPTRATSRQLRFGAAKRLLGQHPNPDEAQPDFNRDLEFHKSEFFDAALPGAGVDALLDHLERARRSGQIREVNFLPMGGAYNRTPASSTAFVHRSHRFLLEHVSRVSPGASPGDRSAAAAWTARSWAVAHPWGSGGVYPNFPDAELTGWEAAYWGAHHSRLRQIKHRYDPGNVFWVEQGLH